jgi:hypothetical protein
MWIKRRTESRLVIAAHLLIVSCFAWAPLGATEMDVPNRTTGERVSKRIMDHDVVLFGTVVKVDSYLDKAPVLDQWPRSSYSVLHVAVHEYFKGSGPDSVSLVYGVVEVPETITMSSGWGEERVPKVGERDVFWLGWWEQQTAEVFSPGEIWQIQEGAPPPTKRNGPYDEGILLTIREEALPLNPMRVVEEAKYAIIGRLISISPACDVIDNHPYDCREFEVSTIGAISAGRISPASGFNHHDSIELRVDRRIGSAFARHGTSGAILLRDFHDEGAIILSNHDAFLPQAQSGDLLVGFRIARGPYADRLERVTLKMETDK